MVVTDHRHDDTNGLLIEGGDFAVVESEQDHIREIIISNKGEWKRHPLVGVGSLDFLNSPGNIDEIKKRIKLQLEFDNFIVEDIVLLDGGEIRVVARRNEDANS